MSKHSLTESRVSDKDGFESFPALWSTVKSTRSPGIFLNFLPYPFSFSPGLLSWSSFPRWGMICFFNCSLQMKIKASLVAQTVKNLPAVQETWVWSLGQEDPLEEEMATCSSILAWRIPWTEEPAGLQSMGLQRVRQDWVTKHIHRLSTYIQSDTYF